MKEFKVLVIGLFNLTAVVTNFYIRNYKFTTSWTYVRPPVLTKNVCLEGQTDLSENTCSVLPNIKE